MEKDDTDTIIEKYVETFIFNSGMLTCIWYLSQKSWYLWR